MLKRPHVAVSPDSRLFVRDRGFEGLAFWRLGSEDGPQPFHLAEVLTSPVSSLAFIAERELIALTRDGELWSWDTSKVADWTAPEPVSEPEDSSDSEPAGEGADGAEGAEPGEEGESEAGGNVEGPARVAEPEPRQPELQEQWKVRLPVRRVVAAAWSDDRRLLAIGDETGALVLVDFASGEPVVARRAAHDDHVVALSFSRAGDKFVSSGRDRVARVWSTELVEPEAVAPRVEDAPAAEAEEIPVVPGDAEGDAPSIVTESEVMDFFDDASSVDEVDAQPNAAESSAPSADEHDANGAVVPDEPDEPQGLTFELLSELHGMEGWAVALAFDSTGARLAAGAMDNGIYLFDLGDEAELSAVRYVHLGWVADVEWSPDDSMLLTGSWDTTVGVFSSEELLPEIAFELHRDYVVDVTFLPGTDWVVSASYDRTAVVWDWAERKAVAQLSGHSDWVHFVLPMDGGRFVTICADGTSRIWSTDGFEAVRSLGVSASAGIEVGAAVDLSEYVDLSGLASRALDRGEDQVFQPVTKYRDMRASAFSAGSGQTAMALLQTALEDAPDVGDFMPAGTSGAAVVDAAAAFDPVLPDVTLPPPKALTAESLDSASMESASLETASLETASEPSAAEAFAASATPEAEDVAPNLGAGLPDVETPEPAVAVPEEEGLPEAPNFEAAPVAPDVVEAAPESVPESVDPSDRADTIREAAIEAPEQIEPEPVLEEPVVEEAEESEPNTLEMSPGMLDDIAETGSAAMVSGSALDPFDDDEPDEDRASTMDGVVPDDDEGLPDVDDAWANIGSDVVEIEEAPVAEIEPAVDMTGPHEAVTAETAREESEVELELEPASEASASAEPAVDSSTMRGRPPVSAEDASSESVPELTDVPEGIGESSGTLGYHEGEGSPMAPGSTQPLHPVGATQPLHPIGGRADEITSPAEDEPEPPRQRAKTATGADLSEDSTFNFFFGQQSEASADEDDDDDEVEATSRLVPERHFSGEFGSSPEVFDTSVSEIWTARPDRSEAKMGIVKKRRPDREYRAAFAIRTYHQWVYSVAISPSGDSIVSCGGNNLVCVWSKVGDLLHQLRAPSSGFNEVKFTPDGTVVVAAGDDGGIHLWMLPQEEYGRIRHAVLDGHDAVVSSVAFTPDGRYMLSGSFDGTARVWDMSDGRCRVVLEDHDGPIADVAIAGRRAYTVGHDGTVRIWDDRKWLAVDVFDGFDKLLGVSSNGVVHAWTAANGDAFFVEDAHPKGLLQHRGEARGVCVTESGMVVTAGQDSQIRVYNRGSSDPAQSLLAPASLWSLDVHDGFIAAGADDGRIHIFRS